MYFRCLDSDQCHVCAFVWGGLDHSSNFGEDEDVSLSRKDQQTNRLTAQNWKCYPPPPKTSMAMENPSFEV